MSGRVWKIRERTYETGRLPLLMGIVNVTPDSFSDGGDFLDTGAAVEHGLSLVNDGADILDLGGESTRPGALPVDANEEIRRVVPVIRQLSGSTEAAISIDTTKASVARAAIEVGASIVNDISGLQFDPQMPAVCADEGVGVVCMHIQGTPETMQADPHYDDVVREICEYFSERLSALDRQGIPKERIVIDPGIGFGKTAEHNVAILQNIASFRKLGRPVLIGHSRKRFLGKVLRRSLDECDAGTLGVSLALAMQSTDILRIHDVRSTRDALLAWRAIVAPDI